MGLPPNTGIAKRKAYKLPKWFYVALFIVPFPALDFFSHWWVKALCFVIVILLVCLFAFMVRIPVNPDYDKKEPAQIPS